MPKPSHRRPTHAFISTYGLNTILPLDAKVEVKIGENRATKFVRDLLPNDLVLGTSPDIRVSLAEIKRALLEGNLDYQQAFWKLHVSGEPQPKPRLQAYLEHVLQTTHTNQGGKSIEASESDPVTRISELLEKVDAKAGALYGNKKTVNFKRTRPTIASWLSGETILPSNPLVLRILRKLDTKKFDELFGPPQTLKPKPGEQPDNSSVLRAHERLWTDHKILTRWRSSFSDKALASEEEVFKIPDEEEINATQPPKSSSRSLAEERRIVYEKLIKPIYDKVDGKIGFIRIKAIKACEAPKKSQQPPGQADDNPNAPALSRGLILSSKIDDELRDKLPPSTSFRELHTEADYLSRVLTGIFENSGIKLNETQLTGGGLLNIIKHDLQTPATGIVLRKTDEGDYEQEELSHEERTRIFNELMTGIRTNSFDARHSLPQGTTQKILERFHELQKTIPLSNERHAIKTSLYYATDIQRAQSAEIKAAVAAINKLAHRLSQYGFQSRLLAADTRRSGGIGNVRQALSQLGVEVDKLDLREYASHELESVLNKLGIEDFKVKGKLIRLSDVNR